MRWSQRQGRGAEIAEELLRGTEVHVRKYMYGDTYEGDFRRGSRWTNDRRVERGVKSVPSNSKMLGGAPGGNSKGAVQAGEFLHDNSSCGSLQEANAGLSQGGSQGTHRVATGGSQGFHRVFTGSSHLQDSWQSIVESSS